MRSGPVLALLLRSFISPLAHIRFTIERKIVPNHMKGCLSPVQINLGKFENRQTFSVHAKALVSLQSVSLLEVLLLPQKRLNAW